MPLLFVLRARDAAGIDSSTETRASSIHRIHTPASSTLTLFSPPCDAPLSQHTPKHARMRNGSLCLHRGSPLSALPTASVQQPREAPKACAPPFLSPFRFLCFDSPPSVASSPPPSHALPPPLWAALHLPALVFAFSFSIVCFIQLRLAFTGCCVLCVCVSRTTESALSSSFLCDLGPCCLWRIARESVPVFCCCCFCFFEGPTSRCLTSQPTHPPKAPAPQTYAGGLLAFALQPRRCDGRVAFCFRVCVVCLSVCEPAGWTVAASCFLHFPL